MPTPKGLSSCKSSWERERERENPRWRSHPYDGGGLGLLLDQENWLKRRGFWFGFKEMSLRSDHRQWWQWWSEEEPRRLGHGSLESRGNGSSVQTNFPRLEPLPSRFSSIMGVVLLIHCCFFGFVALLLLLWVVLFVFVASSLGCVVKGNSGLLCSLGNLSF